MDMDMIAVLIRISIVLILIIIFIVGFVGWIIEYRIRNLKNELNRQEIVNYINKKDVYVRDEHGNILKHHAHISSFNLDDYTKIIIDVKKNDYGTLDSN